jgi:hypothetical protein
VISTLPVFVRRKGVGTALACLWLSSSATDRPATLRHGRADVGIVVQHLDQQSVAQVMDLGLRHIRYTLYWYLWENPTYRREWERGLQRALQAGLDPLIVVHQPAMDDFPRRAMVYQLFARFMEARAAEFPAVRAWQLWNEMDVAFTDVFGAGHSEVSLYQRGRYYAEMLTLAYPAIKRANRKAIVVTGGIASAADGGFLDGLYDGKAPYDVLALHTYGFPLAMTFDARGLAARRIMKEHGDSRPLWNTEFGLEQAIIPSDWRLTAAQIDTAQLQAWQTSIEGNSRARVYDRIYGYVLTEGKDLGFDLVRLDGSGRPAYQWLKLWMRQ